MAMFILETGIVLDQGLDIESSRSFMQIMTSKDEVTIYAAGENFLRQPHTRCCALLAAQCFPSVEHHKPIVCGRFNCLHQADATMDAANGNAIRSPIICGRTISSIPQALAAEEENVDFVLVAAPDADEGMEERCDPGDTS